MGALGETYLGYEEDDSSSEPEELPVRKKAPLAILDISSDETEPSPKKILTLAKFEEQKKSSFDLDLDKLEMDLFKPPVTPSKPKSPDPVSPLPLETYVLRMCRWRWEIRPQRLLRC